MSANTKDPLAAFMNIPPAPRETRAEIVIATPEENQAEKDIQYARGNMLQIIEDGHMLLNDMLQIAAQTQHAKVYEAAAQMIKVMAQTNLDLIEIHQKRKMLRGKIEEPPQVINNNLTLTTEALLRIIKGKNGEETS